jgi:hypothetical protein
LGGGGPGHAQRQESAGKRGDERSGH